jgi:CRP-like cAMP-binding protein
MQDAIAHTLQQHPAFAGLSEADALDLALRTESVTLTAGNVLFGQGEPSRDLYVVLSGALRVTCRGPGGVEVVVGEVRGGSIVGEMGVIDGQARSATVTARGRVELLRIGGAVFGDMVEAAHPAAISLVRAVRRQLVARLRGIDDRVDAVFEVADTVPPSAVEALLYGDGSEWSE